MLRLSELSGFIVCGNLFFEKYTAKFQQRTATDNPFPSKLWGGVIWGVAEREWYIYYISLYGIIKLTCPIAPGPILYGL